MAEQLKNMFDYKYYNNLSIEFNKVYKQFDSKNFTKEVTKKLDTLELNERLRNTAVILNKYLPENYKTTIKILNEVIPNLKTGYTTLVFPEYTALYGLHDFDTSLNALKFFTKFGSSEFAIRVFLKADFNKTIKVLYNWANDDNQHVRRLASEGSRPRLPWSFKLDNVIKNPTLTLPILEILNADKEVYVQKSVANHLNDISKDNPDFVINAIKNWKGKSNETDWILKHGSRTLLKQGNQTVLKFFGVSQAKELQVVNFKILTPKVKMGELVKFNFAINNNGNKKIVARLEFAIYFNKKNGDLNRKVFKISEREINAGKIVEFEKNFSFRPITTRVYYKGKHNISIIVNGKESEICNFILV